MGMSINRVVISGYLCSNPELTTLTSGRVVTNLRVVLSDRERDAAGICQDRPSYLDVVVWGGQAESCCAHLAKGSAIVVDGHLRQDQWQAKDGTPRKALKVVADRVQFTGGGKAETDAAPAAVACADDDISFEESTPC